jgi:hypothetical protein
MLNNIIKLLLLLIVTQVQAADLRRDDIVYRTTSEGMDSSNELLSVELK